MANMLKSDGRIRLKKEVSLLLLFPFFHFARRQSKQWLESKRQQKWCKRSGWSARVWRADPAAAAVWEKREGSQRVLCGTPPSEHSMRSTHTIRSVQSLVCVAPGLPPQTLVTAADRDPGLGAARTHSLAPIFPHGHGQPQWVLRRRHVISTHMLKALWNQEKKMWRERCIDILVAECPSCALSQWRRLEQITYPIMPSETRRRLCAMQGWRWMLAGFVYFLCTFPTFLLYFVLWLVY